MACHELSHRNHLNKGEIGVNWKKWVKKWAIKKDYPSIGKGTVYRHLSILAGEAKIRKVEIPGGEDQYDFTLTRHYHVRCVECGKIFDVNLNEVKEIDAFMHAEHDIQLLDYDIIFQGICKDCQNK